MFTWQTKRAILKALLFKNNPYYVQYYINGACHLKCRQCNIVETNSSLGEMRLDEIGVMARNLREIGGGIVLLTGGEPFLRKDIDQVAAAFLKEGLDVRLQTAGIATDAQLQACYDVGCRDLNISLDSLDEAKQDYINAVPGSWAAAIDAIERVSQIFRGDSAICSLGCVLSRMNFREVPAILEFATSIGWYVSLVPVHIAKRGAHYGFRSFDDEFCFGSEDYPALAATIDTLIAMKRNGYLLFDSETFLRSAFEFLQGRPPTWRKYNDGVCDSPNLYFAVRPNGDFTTCCDYTLPNPPSLRDPGFAAQYRSREVHALAAPITKSCPGCHYGSYPEVTLSVRDWGALRERARVALRQDKQLITRFDRHSLPARIDDIRRRHAGVYAGEAWISPTLQEKVQAWHDPERRRGVLAEDNDRRRAEGRVRQRPVRQEPHE